MNNDRQTNLDESIAKFTAQNITWKSFNDGLHWKVGKINFFPTTHRWNDEETGESGIGIKEALEKISKPLSQARKYLSVEQIFEIAKKHHNLYDKCEAIHKAIYS